MSSIKTNGEPKFTIRVVPVPLSAYAHLTIRGTPILPASHLTTPALQNHARTNLSITDRCETIHACQSVTVLANVDVPPTPYLRYLSPPLRTRPQDAYPNLR